jgi:hypothetical protein
VIKEGYSSVIDRVWLLRHRAVEALILRSFLGLDKSHPHHKRFLSGQGELNWYP